MKPKYHHNFKLLYTDTDSFIFKINIPNVYDDIKEDIHRFDTSDYPSNNVHGMPRVNKKKKVGLMKDDCNGAIMTEFVYLRSKVYSFLVEGEEETKKLKGVKKHALRRRITFEDYKQCVKENTKKFNTMQTIRSYKHDIFSSKLNKLSLSPHDEKRYVCLDGINTLAWGHFRIPTAIQM